ncbi:unnamed protein product [Cylindrotheca closterium]|uniref:histidine kinase n=1 Tax=Cylindrotheca closterium TaxID=2856 RepID=A0AAD2FKN5_9STRA|nr:unnamed protein product [Cylindrotheca closterium]
MVSLSRDSNSSLDDQSVKTYDSKGRLTSRKRKGSTRDAQKKRRSALRAVLILSLLFAIAMCSSLAYTQLQSTEENVGIQTYQSIALSATEGAVAITERKFQGSEVMSTLLGQLYPNAADWPLVAFDGYIPIAQKVASLSASGTQAFMVILDPSEAPAFETHIKQVYRDQGRPENAGYSDFGFGVWRRDGNETKTYPDGRLHDVTGGNSWGGTRNKMAVLAMHNSPAASSLLLNLYPLQSRGIHVESMFDCVDAHDNATTSPSCPVVTDMLELVVKPGPAGLLFNPIFPKNEPNNFVGFATTSLHWDEVLTNVVPDYVSGLTCVVSTATSAFTYEIQNGKPTLVGDGDLHDDKYTSYAKTVVLTRFQTGSTSSAGYTLTVYPTEKMFKAFSTDSPVIVSLGFAAVITAVACLFFGYDFLMRREAEQRKVILEMKRKFVRFISHEIRTPLNTVCMGLELLQAELRAPKGLDGDSKVAQEEDINFWLNVTDDTNENAHVAVEILNDLLNYDKLETGTLELETQPVLIWDLIEKTVSQFGIQAVNRKVELKLDMERPSGETIPDVEGAESMDPYNVIGDNVRLGQILRNVISNALKFTMEDGLIQVTVRYDPNGLPNADLMMLEDEAVPSHDRAGSICISVKDSGVGLSRDQLDRLFSEGVQFDANRLQHGGGSGLGLNIAKGLVEQHCGTIFADSEGLGEGTTFTVELPLYEFGEEELRKAEDDKDSETEPTTANSSVATKVDHTGEIRLAALPLKRRILVAEDSDSSRKMLIRLLERAGHTCVPASNGKEAVECIKKDMKCTSYDPGHIPIDCVLMDYEMPLLRGPDATKRLRNLGFSGIILGVTGNVLSEDVDFFLRHGANEVMPKPISLKNIQKFWKDYESGNWKARQSLKHVQ